MLHRLLVSARKSSALRRAGFPRDESGAAMVEFAVVTGLIFLPLLFGIIEFGRLLWAKNMVTAAAREGVRYAIVHGSDNQAHGGTLFDSASVAAYVEGRTKLSPIQVSVASTGGKDPTDTVTVTVKYNYTPVVSLPIFPAKTVTGVSKQIIAY